MELMVFFFLFAFLDAADIPALFIFGDSLIDVGNNNYINSLAKADLRFNGIDYDQGVPTGRFCNGRTVPDIIGDYMGIRPPPPHLQPNLTMKDIIHGVNYASGAAGILDATGLNYISRISFNQQLDSFASTKQRFSQELGVEKTNELLAKSIYMVEFGANDYINNYLVIFSPTPLQYNSSQFQDMLVQTYAEQLSRLYDLGARKMVVFGVGPLGCIPNQIMRTSDQKCSSSVNNYVKGFNAGVKEQLDGRLPKQLPEARFVFAHGYDKFMDMVQSPESYGFKVTDEGCCGLGKLNGLLACMPISNLCKNRDEYLFWDPFHPTEAANLVLATSFYNGTSPEATPINGVCGMGLIARRLGSSSSISRVHQLLHQQTWLGGSGASALQVRHVKKQIEVILTESIDRLGEAGDVVKVSAGYARNYLCPQLKAMPAIEKYVNLVKQNLKFFPPTISKEGAEELERRKQEKEQGRDVERMLHRFDTRGLVLYKIVKDPTTLRFPVTAQDLVAEVARQLRIEAQAGHFDLPEPLTSLGHFEVPIRLPPDLPLPGGKQRLYLKIRIRRKNYLHNRTTVPPKN